MIELGYFMAGWFAATSSVLLGGWLVYRTKRESHEPLVPRHTKPADTAFNLTDPCDIAEPDAGHPYVPDAVAARADDFVAQFAANLSKRPVNVQ